MSRITLSDLQSCFDDLQVTTHILRHIRIMLNGVFAYAAKRGIIPLEAPKMVSLIDMVARKEPNYIKRKRFTDREIEWLWNHSEDNMTAKHVLIYIYTGMRFKEFQSITEDDVHDNYIDIVQSKTKAGIRIVPLSDKVLSLLPVERVPAYSDFYYRFNELMKLMGTVHTIHDTRHTFISMLTEAQVDARLIKKIVGHASDDVTEDTYTHLSLESMLEAVNKI
mgnify:CR=1 FL=1